MADEQTTLHSSVLEWLKGLGPYQTTILLLAFAPTVVGWTTSGPSNKVSEYLNPTFILIGITAIGFFSSKNNFAGPLRYGITKYGSNLPSLYHKAPDGTVWVLIILRALLPWSQTWLISILSIIWQCTLQHFREDVRDVMDTANNLCARATIAATAAKEDVDAALHHEQDALVNGSQALRDARQAEQIKASDFFDAATNAWAGINTAAEAIKKAREYSSTASSAAENARSNSYNSSSSQSAANSYVSYTSTATTNTEEAYRRSCTAINVMTNFQTAKNQDIFARERTTEHATNVKKTVRELISKTNELPSDLATVLKDAQAVRHKASLAVAKAEQGRLGDAGELAREAEKELEELEEEVSRIAGVRDEVRELVVKQFLGF